MLLLPGAIDFCKSGGLMLTDLGHEFLLILRDFCRMDTVIACFLLGDNTFASGLHFRGIIHTADRDERHSRNGQEENVFHGDTFQA